MVVAGHGCESLTGDMWYNLPESVATVDEAVVASHVRRTVRCEVDGEVVEVVNGTEALLRGVIDPDALLSLEGRDTVEGGVHVAGRDGIDANAVASPLSGERLRELDNGSLGSVVARLLLWVIDNRAGHGSNVDDAAAGAETNHLTADGLVDQEAAVHVDVDETTELLDIVGLSLEVGAVKC